MNTVYIGVDGGNSKTEVAVSDANGRLLTMVRGDGSSPDKIGYSAATKIVADLITEALHAVPKEPTIQAISAYIAGLDLPQHITGFQQHMELLFPHASVIVGNDTQAVLQAGTGGEPGIVLVCGAGINGMYRNHQGQSWGFLSMGQLTGDWGGGISLGRDALFHAVRMEDGRGQQTLIHHEVLECFGEETAVDLALSIHQGKRRENELAALVPGIFRAHTQGDQIAEQLVERQAEELATMVSALAARAGLENAEIPVVLAGGVLTAQGSPVAKRLIAKLEDRWPLMSPKVLSVPPVVGSLIGALEVAQGPITSQGEIRAVRDSMLSNALPLGNVAARSHATSAS